MKYRNLVTAALAVTSAITVVPQAAAEHAFLYTDGLMIDLGTLGGTWSRPVAINASGQITGTSETADGSTHAFLYSGGVMTDLGTLGGTYSAASAINDSGQVVGEARRSDGTRRAFLYSDGAMIDLGKGWANAVNTSGQVVGSTGNDAFLYSNGATIDLGTLYGPFSEATGINDSGQVVGYRRERDGVHWFLYGDGVMTVMGVGYANAINDAGQVAGHVLTLAGTYVFLHNDGLTTVLGDGGWRSSWSRHILNEAGQVVWSLYPRAFLYGSGVTTDLGELGMNDAAAINDSGQVVGHTWSGAWPEYGYRMVLYSAGLMTVLDTPHKISTAVAMNDSGQIVGYMVPGSCDDGNPCTSGDTWNWSGDVCAGTGPADGCSDGNPCTLDTCDAQDVCQHAIFTGPTDGCSDGDPCTLDTCDALGVCQHAMFTGPTDGCSDDNACTLDTCDDLGVCQHASTCDCPLVPSETCLSAGQSSFLVKDLADDTRDQIKWSFRGDDFVQADLGNPQNDTSYSLCVYDFDFLVGGFRISPNSQWRDRHPWGWIYSDRTGSQSGVRNVRLRTGDPRTVKVESKVALHARGANIPMPGPRCVFYDDYFCEWDTYSPIVTVQLFNDTTPTCWTSAFTSATVNVNDGTQFKARTP